MNVIPLHGDRLRSVGQPWVQHCRLGGAHGLIHGASGNRPCAGYLRFVDVRGPIDLAECDECGYETGVPR